MNENLKEIAIKAQVEHCISHVRLEEFAELIIRECADISEASFHNGSAGYLAILKHFGIEP